MVTDGELSDKLLKVSHRLEDEGDLEPLLETIGDARYVLIGEASHGTSEFYSWRARLSKRLIEEKRLFLRRRRGRLARLLPGEPLCQRL